MNYDRRMIEALKQKQQEFKLPFARAVVVLSAVVLALLVVLH